MIRVFSDAGGFGRLGESITAEDYFYGSAALLGSGARAIANRGRVRERLTALSDS